MKIQVDGKTVYELNETKKKVIQNNIPSEIFQQDMERRVKWVIEHKYEQCFERLKKEWERKLQSRIDNFPSDPDKFAELVFSQPDYKSRSEREKEKQEKSGKR